MDPEKSAKMFVQWQKWRATMVPNGFIYESEIQDELLPRKSFLHGLSNDGFPVLHFKACEHFSSKDRHQFKNYALIEELFICPSYGPSHDYAIGEKFQHKSFCDLDNLDYIMSP
ncbi:hypothetical protein QYF36_011509 [Acer negundo]|nr:hypothetical protein QYF36_011509 [Acer negundo]